MDAQVSDIRDESERAWKPFQSSGIPPTGFVPRLARYRTANSVTLSAIPKAARHQVVTQWRGFSLILSEKARRRRRFGCGGPRAPA